MRPPKRGFAPLFALLLSAFLAGATSVSAFGVQVDAASDETVEAPSEEASALPPAAPPPLPIECRAADHLCDLAEDAATRLAFPWVAVGYTLRIEPAPDDWHAGVSRHEERVIELYVRESSTPHGLQRTFGHEVAHAMHTVCPDRLREWRARRGLPAAVPDHVPAPHDYDSVAEDFAEAFTQYLGLGTSRSTVGLPVTDEWLQRNADLFLLCEGPA